MTRQEISEHIKVMCYQLIKEQNNGHDNKTMIKIIKHYEEMLDMGITWLKELE